MDELEKPMNVDEKSSSSSNLSDDEDQGLINRAEELERQINVNKNLYDLHVEIVDIYRKLGDLNSMRAAYQRFHKYFPLTSKLWLDWIRDEIKIANTPEEQKHVFVLFDKAVEDYLSVELWLEYAQYSIGVSDLETTRCIIERGLTAAGLHVTEGYLLWDALRELENAHIALKQEGSEEWKIQINRLADVFKRQLSVPLFNMENTYHEWQEWFKSIPEGTVDPKPIEWGYKNAMKAIEIYKPFEEKLLMVESNPEVYNIYKEYVKAVKDPSTILCLYERAALHLCLLPELWLDYCMYAFNLGETALKVICKALRNCPWSEELWTLKLRILENLKVDENDILECFEQGTSVSESFKSNLDLWLTFLEYMHRNCHNLEKLDKLFCQATEQLGFENDPSCKVSRWHARNLAKRGNMSAAREIWNTILHHVSNKSSASVWLEYASLEKQYGDISRLRNLFQRALSSCTDWRQYIAEEWLMFERENGNLDNIMQCIKKIRNLGLPQTQAAQASTATVTSADHQQGRKRRFDDVDERKYKNKRIRNAKPEEKQLNIKPEPQLFKNKHIEKDPKKTVFVSNLHPSVDETKLKELFPNSTCIELVRDHRGKSHCYGFVQFTMEEEVMTALARDRCLLEGRPVFISELKTNKADKPEFKYATTTEKNKLFIRGLPKNKTKEDVTELFKDYNPIDVRLVLHKNGEPKGLAYVEFDTETAAKNALEATNQMTVDDQVITVEISAPPQKKRGDVSKPVRHARSRLQVPLIPRSLQVKGSTKEGLTTNGSKNKDEVSKSNADFRKMLFKS